MNINVSLDVPGVIREWFSRGESASKHYKAMAEYAAREYDRIRRESIFMMPYHGAIPFLNDLHGLFNQLDSRSRSNGKLHDGHYTSAEENEL